MKRQRYERTDVPTASPLRTVLSLVALVAIALAGWALVRTLWAKARLDSSQGNAQLAVSITNAPEPKGLEGYVVTDHDLTNVLLLVTDDLSLEAPTLVDAKVLSIDSTSVTGTLVSLPANVRVNPDTTPQTLQDLYADSGASACVSAVSKRCGIPLHHVIVVDEAGWELLRGLDGVGAQKLQGQLLGILDAIQTDMGAPELIDLDERVQAVGFSSLSQLDLRPGSEWVDGDGATWMVVYDYEVAPAIGYLVPAE